MNKFYMIKTDLATSHLFIIVSNSRIGQSCRITDETFRNLNNDMIYHNIYMVSSSFPSPDHDLLVDMNFDLRIRNCLC